MARRGRGRGQEEDANDEEETTKKEEKLRTEEAQKVQDDSKLVCPICGSHLQLWDKRWLKNHVKECKMVSMVIDNLIRKPAPACLFGIDRRVVRLEREEIEKVTHTTLHLRDESKIANAEWYLLTDDRRRRFVVSVSASQLHVDWEYTQRLLGAKGGGGGGGGLGGLGGYLSGFRRQLGRGH